MKTKILVFLALIGITVIISSFSFLSTSCSPGNAMEPPTDYPKYLSDWKRVDSLEKRRLPKSALKIVDEIYIKAKAEENYPQFIKASLYKLKLQSDFKEDFMEMAISDLNDEIAQSESPVKQILYSIQAELYWRYYQSNRYKFMERTVGGDINSDDIKTWDLKHLLDVVIKNYLASLENPDDLKRTHLKDYDAILDTSKHSKEYRPTIYDFL
ncbi:MAG: hypothetical protein GXO89_12755, partial [Chlorobi bacterium]|nr:hypothetical protein [Chlorobiota bacterium]